MIWVVFRLIFLLGTISALLFLVAPSLCLKLTGAVFGQNNITEMLKWSRLTFGKGLFTPLVRTTVPFSA